MKAAVVLEPGRLEIADVPDPQPDGYQVLVRTLAGGVCGTDRHIVAGTFYRHEYPSILGHETIGQVVEAGSAVRSFRAGDLVLRTYAVRPGERLGAVGSMLGGFAEWGVATDTAALVEDGRAELVKPYDRMQQVVPAGFDPLDAGAFIVLKETLSWLRRLADPGARRVLIVGTGAAALTFVQLARHLGAAQVIVAGRRQSRLDHAVRLGADEAIMSRPEDLAGRLRELTSGHGVDIAIDAAGTVDVLDAIPDGLARGGIIGVYGISAGQSATLRWGWGRPAPRTWSLRFEEPDEAGVHDEALALVQTGVFALKSTLTHVVPFGRVGEILEVMGREGACKVAIDFRDTALPR